MTIREIEMGDESRGPIIVETDPSPGYPDPFCSGPMRLRHAGRELLDVRYACTYHVEGPQNTCTPGSQTAIYACTLGPGDTYPLGCSRYFSPQMQCAEIRSWKVISFKPIQRSYVEDDDLASFDGYITDALNNRHHILIQINTSKKTGDLVIGNMYAALKGLRKLKAGSGLRARAIVNGIEGDWEWTCLTEGGEAQMKLLGNVTEYTDASSLMYYWIPELRLPTVRLDQAANKVFETTISDLNGTYEFKLDLDEIHGEANAVLPHLGPSKMTGLHRGGPAKISGWVQMITIRVLWQIEAVAKGATFDCVMVQIGTTHRYTTPDGKALDAFLRGLTLPAPTSVQPREP